MENNKKNIAQILISNKVPAGAKLYSPAFGEITLIRVDESNPNMKMTPGIHCRRGSGVEVVFFVDGTLSTHGEVMLFPSKENRDWTKFKYMRYPKTFEEFREMDVFQECLKEDCEITVYPYKYNDSDYARDLREFYELIALRDFYNYISCEISGRNKIQSKAAIAYNCQTKELEVIEIGENTKHKMWVFSFHNMFVATKFLINFKSQIERIMYHIGL